MICDFCQSSVSKLVSIHDDDDYERVCTDCKDLINSLPQPQFPTDECTECCSWALPGDTKCMYHKYNENK